MRLLVDENLPVEVAELLRQAGHDAAKVTERRLSGTPDAGVAALCLAEGRALITLDVDFGNTQLYPPAEYVGLVVLRLERQDKAHVLAVVTALIPRLTDEELVGRLWVVDEERIRIR